MANGERSIPSLDPIQLIEKELPMPVNGLLGALAEDTSCDPLFSPHVVMPNHNLALQHSDESHPSHPFRTNHRKPVPWRS